MESPRAADDKFHFNKNFSDEESFLQAVMRWHFSPETGTEFWLSLAPDLGFDPLRDIHNYDDLKKFPDISAKLRDVRAETLIPRGIRALRPQLSAHVFESGGTTGKPKFFVYYDEWVAEVAEFMLGNFRLPRGNFLSAVPTGPHFVGSAARKCADILGGLCFNIDLDPRWVRAAAAQGDKSGAERYVAHLIEQIAAVAAAQKISYMFTTPPLLRALAKNSAAIESLRPHLRLFMLAGAEINLDEVQLIAETVLPDCAFYAHYGSTSAGGTATAPLITADTEQLVYEAHAPFIRYNIVHPETMEDCAEGERGRVVVSHLTPYAFYPYIIERDTAVKCAPPPGVLMGSRLADIVPDKAQNGKKLEEGVY